MDLFCKFKFEVFIFSHTVPKCFPYFYFVLNSNSLLLLMSDNILYLYTQKAKALLIAIKKSYLIFSEILPGAIKKISTIESDKASTLAHLLSTKIRKNNLKFFFLS